MRPEMGSSIRAYSPLGITQVSAVAMRMMTTRMTKVWGMVKPFFFACGEVPDDINSNSFYKLFTHTVFPTILTSISIKSFGQKSNSLFFIRWLKKIDIPYKDGLFF